MSDPLFEVPDGRGCPVALLERTWEHIVEGHPEMAGEEEALRLTISEPDLVVRPPKGKRPRGRGVDRRINCRLGPHSRYNALYVWVPIDYERDSGEVRTAYLSSSVPKGELIFVRVPSHWS